MAAIDWADLTRTGRLEAEQIPPGNLEDTYGPLEGVDWASSSFTAGYYTDTRTSGSLALVDGNWIPNAWVRIIYYPDKGDENAQIIGTYIVVDDPTKTENGALHQTLELHSILYGIDQDKVVTVRHLAKGSTIKAAFQAEFKDAGVSYKFSGNNVSLSKTMSLESGVSRLSRLFTLCKMSNNRVDVDAKGYITIKPYILPSNKTPKFTIDFKDPRGIALDGIERSRNWMKIPSTTAVLYKYTVKVGDKQEQRQISVNVNSNASGHASHSARGYRTVDLHVVSELDPPTVETAKKLALQYFAKDRVEQKEWTCSIKYLPIWEGDVLEIVVPDEFGTDAGRHKCLVKTATFKGPFMDIELTLKETSSGDDEE